MSNETAADRRRPARPPDDRGAAPVRRRRPTRPESREAGADRDHGARPHHLRVHPRAEHLLERALTLRASPGSRAVSPSTVRCHDDQASGRDRGAGLGRRGTRSGELGDRDERDVVLRGGPRAPLPRTRPGGPDRARGLTSARPGTGAASGWSQAHPGFEVGIPIAHMIDELARALSHHETRVSRVGLPATNGTVGSGLFQNWLDHAGIDVLLPPPHRQREVMTAIRAVRPVDAPAMRSPSSPSSARSCSTRPGHCPHRRLHRDPTRARPSRHQRAPHRRTSGPAPLRGGRSATGSSTWRPASGCWCAACGRRTASRDTSG
jgi:hypothetical protein